METLQEPEIRKPPQSQPQARLPEPPKSPAPRQRRYSAPRDGSFWGFLPVSVITLFTAAYVTARFAPVEEPVKEITVELNDIDAVENEPPPLGESDAPKEELPPQPEPTPPPAEPDPTPPPPPVEKPEFELPEPAPTPAATPKPVQEKPKPKPEKPKIAPKPTTAPAASTAVKKGVPNGKVGGRGGSKGDFLATPRPQYDGVSLLRRYQGVGEVLIAYENGRITSVVMARSTGVSYLDSRTTTWVKNRYKVKPGVSGRATFSISWTLPKK
ncbi:MAG TPA: hypothetical protein VIT91_21550 [Chthoniobacterales bacterium]